VTDTPKRLIKSFVRRAGRISPRQQQGLDHCLLKYGVILSDKPWDYADLFGRRAEVVLEIGFGMGHSLLTMALAQPEVDFIGIEVHQAGVGSLAADLQDQAVNNVRIAPYDAVDVLQQGIVPASLAGIQIFFPDPWPKARHHKRRLIQPDFVRLLVDKLKPGGFLHLATDWEDYAAHMYSVVSCEARLTNQASTSGFISRPETRPMTKFEKRGLKLGHKIWDLQFINSNSG
jgi:tRNA (guanine-N7-)-methyltransferase